MRTSTPTWLIALLLLSLLPAVALSKTQPPSFKASFTAEYTMQIKVPDTKPGAPKGATKLQAITIPGQGEIIWSDPNLRVDFTNGLNQEAMRLLVDFSSGKAVMLYPDTLNGYRTDLKAMDKHGYMPVAQGLLSRSNENATPQGFQKKTIGVETINYQSATHTQYSRKDGIQADIWRAKSGDPVRFSAKTGKGKLVLNFTSYKRNVRVQSDAFAISKDYQLEDVKEPPSEFTQ